MAITVVDIQKAMGGVGLRKDLEGMTVAVDVWTEHDRRRKEVREFKAVAPTRKRLEPRWTRCGGEGHWRAPDRIPK
jgi:hypothetical protein